MATTPIHTPLLTLPQKPSNASPSSPPSKTSPSLDDIKQTARLAAVQIRRTINPAYPRRFRNINDAKEHVKDLCHSAGFDYLLPAQYDLCPGSPHFVAQEVVDRAAFLVAVHAYTDKEFYLDEAMPDRQKLRDAIESNVKRALSVIKVWPSRFAGAEAATQWVQRTVAQRGFAYTRFEGVPVGKFHGYVAWNTARKAWEENRFELDNVPRGWMRTISSMNAAIEADIARLRQLICSWPATFPHLNAARNFVGEWSYIHRFQYTGWENVESRKYRLYVNWAMAKQGLAGGLFKVSGDNPARTLPRPVMARSADDKKKHDAKVAAWMQYTTHGSDAPAPDVAGPLEPTAELMVNDTESVPSPSSPASSASGDSVDSPAPSLSKTAGSDDTLIDLEEEEEEEVDALQLDKQDEASVDPFKHLVSALKHSYLAKRVAEPVVREAPAEIDIIEMAFD